MDSNIVFEETYECIGLWTKILKKRNSGDTIDPYITTPERKRLRSGAELYKFIEKNKKYWPIFDATVINFERKSVNKYSKWTQKLIGFLENVRPGVSSHKPRKSEGNKKKSLEKPENIKSSVKPKIGPKTVRERSCPKPREGFKSYSKPKMGPKSIMEKWNNRVIYFDIIIVFKFVIFCKCVAALASIFSRFCLTF